MKSFAVVVFLASFVLVVHWAKGNDYCPASGITSNRAFKNLMGARKGFFEKLKLTNACELDMVEKIEDETNDQQLIYQKTCYAVGKVADLTVWVLSKTRVESPPANQIQQATKDCIPLQPYQALYLPQRDNKNTFMILDPLKASLFFTTRLSGCDIFLANSNSKPKQPMVIHSNKNSCGSRPENLKEKGEEVDKLLKKHVGYKLVLRAYSKPPKYDADVEKYIKEYKKNHKDAKVVAYDVNTTPQFFHFMGVLKRATWQFLLKGDVNGKIIWKT